VGTGGGGASAGGTGGHLRVRGHGGTGGGSARARARAAATPRVGDNGGAVQTIDDGGAKIWQPTDVSSAPSAGP
jgi:hypothetical protein